MKTLLFTHLLTGLLQWFVLAMGFMYGVLLILTWSTLIDFIGFLPLEIGSYILAIVLGLWIVGELISAALSKRHDVEVSNTVFTPGMIIWMMMGVLYVFYQYIILSFIDQPSFLNQPLVIFERVYWPMMFIILVLERTLRDPQGKIKNQIAQSIIMLTIFGGIAYSMIWLNQNRGVYGLVQEVTFQTPTTIVLEIKGGMTFQDIESLNRFAPILYESNRSINSELTYLWPTSGESLTNTFSPGKNEVEARINHIRSFNEFAKEHPTTDPTIRSLNQATITSVKLILPQNSETIEKLFYIVEGQNPRDTYRTSLWGNQLQDFGINRDLFAQRIGTLQFINPNETNQ
jgi:hypothetical protein